MLVWWAMADTVNNAVTAFPLAAQTRVDTRHDRLAREITELFEQWRPGMFRYLVSLGLTAHDSEEVIQETFLALFSHLQKEKVRTNLRGWLFRVAHNLGLKHQLAARKSAAFEPGDEIPHPALNPEEQLARTRRERQIISVLSALPERDRHCLFLRAEGLRYREIAGVLGVSLGTVAGSLERALGRLQRACQR